MRHIDRLGVPSTMGAYASDQEGAPGALLEEAGLVKPRAAGMGVHHRRDSGWKLRLPSSPGFPRASIAEITPWVVVAVDTR